MSESVFFQFKLVLVSCLYAYLRKHPELPQRQCRGTAVFFQTHHEGALKWKTVFSYQHMSPRRQNFCDNNYRTPRKRTVKL